MIDEISNTTDYSKYEVYGVLKSLSSIITDKLANTTEKTEIKIIPGLKVIGKYKSKSDMNNKYENITDKEPKDKISVSVKLTDDYKQKINELHKQKIQ